MFYKYSLFLLMSLLLLSGCSTMSLSNTTRTVQAQAQTVQDPATEPLPADPVEGPAPKNVYLTFDDGPNSHFTALILDILKQYEIKATFVVLGCNVDKNPQVLERIIREGHSVVNHGYSHDYNKIYASPEAFLDDLNKCNRFLEPFTGGQVKIFRAPGGPDKLGKDYLELLKKNGFISLGWNVSSADTASKGVSPEQIIANVENGVIRVEGMNKAPIIIMHDGTEVNLNANKPGTAAGNYIHNRESDLAALPVIIEFLQARNYTFAGVDENTPPAW